MHLQHPPDEPDLARLQATLQSDIVLSLGQEPPESPSYQVLVAGRPSETLLDASPQLERVVIPFAGVPEVTRERLGARSHLALHNLHHNADLTAEMAVALLLAAARLVVPADRALRDGDWEPPTGRGNAVTLAGKTALVLGYGAIGRRVARRCRGLGMTTIGIRRRPQPAADGDPTAVHTPDALPDLLPSANALIICLPHAAGTTGLIDRQALARLPARAVLVNVARGPVVDEDALFDALASGQLHAAGLDVWWRYPERGERRATQPATRPFHELDNVVMSPHRSGATVETESFRMDALAALLDTIARGDTAHNRVDLALGY